MKTNSCIRNLLKFICVLQDNSCSINSLDTDCSRPFLSPALDNVVYNTRVITLYNKYGEEITANYNIDSTSEVSPFFRISKIDGDCCCLLILREENNNYFSTGQFFTIKISCICALKCILDVNVDNL